MLGLGLFAAGGLKQLRIDHEADLHRLGKDLQRCRGHRRAEGLVQPFLKMAVGHSDRQLFFLPAKVGMAFKPQFVTRRADTPHDGLLQSCHDLTVTNNHCIPR